jgi:hypothetical protein
MIVKPMEQKCKSSDPRLRAGQMAEEQMAFYLHREFANAPDIYILHDLRLVDPEQPEHNGSPGVCQIDHLVIHPWGMFIIESKSITGKVTVRDDGSGGDEWARTYGMKEVGFASPIRQATRQAEFMREFLQRNRENLLGKVSTGLRTIAKLVAGSDQRGFRNMPIQIIVAISDGGRIQRIGGWTEPSKPFRTFVCKADLVPDKIREEVNLHRRAGRLIGVPNGEYGIWSMETEEVSVVAKFLAERDTPRFRPVEDSTPVPVESTPIQEATPKPEVLAAPATAAVSAGAACQSCQSAALTAKWGKYGYYWSCNDCSKNTAMPTVCSKCGTEGKRGKIVRIRKAGPKFFRSCDKCQFEEEIWSADSLASDKVE